jgi:pimeloyl-ACP methyl ester carboxylesterase
MSRAARLLVVAALGLPAASAALILTGCSKAPAPPAGQASDPPFTSDRIGVVTRGTGPDIILVPGMNSHRDVWDAIADSLEGRYRLHLVQLNGFAGLAPGANADGPVSAPAAEEIGRYITETGLTRPAVVGHSMGGTIAMMLAARHPDQVGHLMVVDMPPALGVMFSPPGAGAEDLRRMADSMRAGILAAAPGTGMFEQMVPTMTKVDSLKPMLLEGSRGSHPATTANAFHELVVTDLRPELPRITAPMTVLYVLPPNSPIPLAQYDSALRALYANAPNPQIVKIEDSYHFIQFDQPGRLIAELDAMLRR